jgi:hypothetical protein
MASVMRAVVLGAVAAALLAIGAGSALAKKPAVTRAGKSSPITARHNGNAAQCVGVACH